MVPLIGLCSTLLQDVQREIKSAQNKTWPALHYLILSIWSAWLSECDVTGVNYKILFGLKAVLRVFFPLSVRGGFLERSLVFRVFLMILSRMWLSAECFDDSFVDVAVCSVFKDSFVDVANCIFFL